MDFLECGICHIPYNEDDRRPRNSPCGHEFCSTCLKALITDGEYVCPKCREKSNVNAVEELSVNFGLIDVIRAFKANTITLTKEVNERVPVASNEEVCNVHCEPITDWCDTCQLWICTTCLEAHPSLIGCSTSSSSKAMADLKDSQNGTVDKLLDKFKEDTYFVTSEIQEHTDKMKEHLEIAAKHEEEAKKLQEVLSEGNNHKDKLVDAKKHLNETKTPFELCDSIKLVTQRKQALISWSAKNAGTYFSSKQQLLEVLKRKDVYAEKIIEGERKHRKLSQQDGIIYVHTFQTMVVDNKQICQHYDQLEKIIPTSASLVFFEFSLGGVVQGKVHLHLNKNYPNTSEYIVQLVSGEYKQFLNGSTLNYNENLLYDTYFSFSEKTFSPDKYGKFKAKKGDVFGKFSKGYISHIYFEMSTTEKDYGNVFPIFGSVEKGMEVLQRCFDNRHSGVVITDCGFIIKSE